MNTLLNLLKRVAFARATQYLTDLGFQPETDPAIHPHDQLSLIYDNDRFRLTLDEQGSFHLRNLSDPAYNWSYIRQAIALRSDRFTPSVVISQRLIFSILIDLHSAIEGIAWLS